MLGPESLVRAQLGAGARPTPAQIAHARAELRLWGERMPNVVKADHQWVALLSLEQNREVEELIAAGVGQRRIDALYPVKFAHLIPGIIELITPEAYAALNGSENWRESGAYPKNIARAAKELHAQLDSETNRLVSSETYANLRAHIASCLPGTTRERRAKAMALGLWYAHWGTEHLHGTDWGRAMRKAFVNTVDWVLPGLGR